jgi:hypothetical protein
MSLIPSESANFPDSFRAKVGWRLTEKVESSPARTPRRRAPSAPPKPVDRPSPSREKNAAGEPSKPSALNPVSAAPEPVAATPTEEEDPQLELIPNAPLDSGHSPVDPGTADMNALLRHFFASAAASSVSIQPASGEPSISAPEPIVELPMTPIKASDEVPAIAPEGPSLPNAPVACLPAQAEPVLAVGQSTVDSSTVDSPPVESEQTTAAAQGLPSLEPAPPPGPVTIETPAQAQHILELIAAAVQRGALAGETGPPPPPETNIALPVTSSPSEDVSVPAEPPPPSPVPLKPTPSAAIPKSSDVPKAPARIRITPRKIKPRVLPEPSAEPEIPVAPASVDLPSQMVREVNSLPIERQLAEASPASQITVSPPTTESPARPTAPRVEQPARKLPPPRLALAQSDLLAFTARERRNRWIGFGLSEIAVISALVLLGRFGFVHHFPDPTLKLLVFILIFTAAAVAVALPIAFFRNDPRRWARPE